MYLENIQQNVTIRPRVAIPKREIMEHFTTEEVIKVTAQILEHTPKIELKLKTEHIFVKTLLANFQRPDSYCQS